MVDLTTGVIVGQEALARWTHPERGVLRPAQFMPTAEDRGLSARIDDAVLDQACRRLAADPDLLGFASVNLSLGFVLRPDLADRVRIPLARHAVDADRLVLELTEGVVLQLPRTARRNLEALDAAGVRVFVDDFGSGYGALAVFDDLPVRGVKLDRSLINGVGRDNRSEQMLVGLRHLVDALGVMGIVEGIETDDELARVRMLGWTHGQGYLLGAPGPSLRRLRPIPAAGPAPHTSPADPSGRLGHDGVETVEGPSIPFDPGGISVDADVVAQFQFTGQDIPWLLRTWAEAQPDTPLLVWEPKEGSGARWTYGEFLAATRAPGGRSRRQGHHQGRQGRHPLRQLPGDGARLVRLRHRRRRRGHHQHPQRRRRDAVLHRTDRRGRGHHPAAVRRDGRGGRTRPEVDRRHRRQQRRTGHRRGSGPRLRIVRRALRRRGRLPRAPRRPLAPAGIMFTSGTTSRPKAVVHTHANALWAAEVGPTNISMHPGGVYLIFLPYFHVNAQSWSMWSTVLGAGGTIVLQPKFSASRFWEVIAKHDVTHISLLPIVYTTTAGQTIPPNKLEVGVFGAIAPPIEQMLGGVKVVPTFGMTETVTHASTAAPYQHIPPGLAGQAHPGVRVPGGRPRHRRGARRRSHR